MTIAHRAFYTAAALLIAAIVVELAGLLALNGGHIGYTLDDPYIHLALAENIIHGDYGVNIAIYDDVFPKGVPQSWIKLGELHLGRRLIIRKQ
jgi:hypothetical protein